MSAKDGGPAFPVVSTEYNQGREEFEVVSAGGMSLRDYFAAKVIGSSVAFYCGSASPQEIAKRAYEVADAMLKARES